LPASIDLRNDNTKLSHELHSRYIENKLVTKASSVMSRINLSQGSQ